MSREIDTSDLDALSDDDIIYLHQRDKVADYVLADRGIDVVNYGKAQVPLEEQANTGNANTAGLSKEEFERAIELLRADQATEAEADDEDDEDDEEDTRPYEERTNDELREELARRNLEVSGNKAELIDRLTEDDDTED